MKVAESTQTDVSWPRVVAVGLIAGVTSGLFGVGGGTIIVPGLIAVAGFAPKLATGTSLTAIVPIAISGTIGYGLSGEVEWLGALALAAGAFGGAVVGTQVLRRINASNLQVIFAGVLVIAAWRMWAGTEGGSSELEWSLLTAIALFLVGVASGILAGLLGVGGGVLMVPAMALGFGLPVALAKGTSLAVIVPTAVVGTVRNRKVGFSAIKPAMVVGCAGIVSAFAASRFSLGLDEQLAARLFAAFLVIIALRMAYTARRDAQ